jgi:hypothetical protein
MKNVRQGAIPHLVSVARLPQNGMNLTLTANAKELSALAKAHDLIHVQSFKAELLVKKWRKDGVKITGRVTADITQNCVITLEPLDNRVENEIDTIFVPENSKLARPPLSADGEMVIDFEGADIPETFSGDTIDAGALAEEFFGLAIDPYPRKPGASLEQGIEQDGQEAAKPSPFAGLLKFRRD